MVQQICSHYKQSHSLIVLDFQILKIGYFGKTDQYFLARAVILYVTQKKSTPTPKTVTKYALLDIITCLQLAEHMDG